MLCSGLRRTLRIARIRPRLPALAPRSFSTATGGGEAATSSGAAVGGESTAEQVANAAGTIEAAASSDWHMSPTWHMQTFLEFVHTSTGMPWWITIAGVTAGIRFVLFPIFVYQQRTTAKMTNLRPELEKIQQEMKDKRASGNFSAADQQYFAQKQADMFMKNNINILSMFAPFAQAPIFVTMFFGLQTIHSRFPDISTGGISWITDLSVADPYYILPITSAITMLLTIEIGSMNSPQNAMSERMKFVMRGVTLLIVPMTGSFPAVPLAMDFLSHFLSFSFLSFFQSMSACLYVYLSVCHVCLSILSVYRLSLLSRYLKHT
mmetsp:Transcript_14238/g.27998  ORF Transcript_14238/g.27998 Transcript_14238/m.27998 type:complete len:321 (+) Transcript_14238:40-1002(+)